MSDVDSYILYDSINDVLTEGEFKGSIISRCNDVCNSLIFSDNIKISESEGISISQGLQVGFEEVSNKQSAFSRKLDYNTTAQDFNIEYSIMIPEDVMQLYDEGQFSDAFPYTLNLLHTAGLYLRDPENKINHLDFFKGEILKNPISLIMNGILIADRVVIDHRGDPVFYDCLIVGRDQDGNLKVSYEPLANVDDKVVEYIIILGIEELKI
ncbi:MAG: hypothetical protein EU542_03860 [Promethearchaeota archaeon]|nr:MAG: hypothetical protein EU542_03860 [Candidatus Lokiarchaeota archaeon]